MWMLPLFALAAAPAVGTVTLPTSIQTTLDQEYPGWKLAPTSKNVNAEFLKFKSSHPPSVATADFNRDGKKDYAIQIALTKIGEEEQIILVFLAQPDGTYGETVVQSMGLDPNSYLWIQTKSLPVTGGDAQEKLVNTMVLRVMGGPAGDIVYFYDNDHFAELPLKENPDTPDASMPHVEPPL